MLTQQIITALLIGLSAGVLSGLVGVGGGIIMVPALVFFMQYTQHQAQGTSLAVLTGCIEKDICHYPVLYCIKNAELGYHAGKMAERDFLTTQLSFCAY